MSMKNNLSFLIDAQLSLYEHQSTYSPNLSLRFLFYLSDMFSGMISDLYTVKEEDPMLDLKALMLNVNQGHNPELMEACHTLWEYAEYTGRVRKYAKEHPIAEALEEEEDTIRKLMERIVNN